MQPFDPNEAMRRAEEQHQRFHQAVDAQKHDVRRLFTEIKKEHLVTLHDLLGSLVNSDEEVAAAAAHFHGQAKIYLEMLHKICSACGKDHDEAIQDVVGTPATPTGVIADPAYQAIVDDVAKAAGPATLNEHYDGFKDLPEPYRQFLLDQGLTGLSGPDLKVGEAGRLSLRQVKAMEHWRLDDLREKTDLILLGFVCVGYPQQGLECGMRYPSIEDRAMKAPDDCSGCHIKAAHG